MPAITTVLHAEHERLGARLVPYAGWLMPIQYAGITAEHRAVREAAGLFDVSHMGELEITGPGAVAAVGRLITNDLGRLDPGRALYTCCCNESGGILDDLICYLRAPDRVLVVCNCANREKIVTHFETHASGPDATVRDASSDYALLALQGPRAFEILTALGAPAELEQALPSFGLRETEVAGMPTLLARTGYTGEDGVELFCSPGGAPGVFRSLLEMGADHGLVPAGLGARDTLRLEARLSLYGQEIDETTHPFEAGLGWTVKLAGRDFIGRDALAKLREQPLSRKLVGFEMVGRGIARSGYPLLAPDGAPIGTCTSGSPAPTLGKNIGLGYLPPAHAQVGTPIAVSCRGKSVAAVVVNTPFYRRDRPPS